MKFDIQLEQPGDSEMFEDLERYLRFHPKLTRFLFNPAGATFVIGWILWIGMLLGWVGIYIVNAVEARHVLTLIGVQTFSGKEVAIPLGVQLGVPVLLVFGVVVAQDLISTAWVYPVFYLFRKHNVGRENFAGYFFGKMEEKAAKNRAFIEKYGAFGLFLFMLIPFAVNGPLIGAILGKLAGVRTRYILPTVVLATLTTAGLWTGLWYGAYPTMVRFTAHFGGEKYISLAMLSIAALVLLFAVLGFLRDVRGYKRRQVHQESPATPQTEPASPAHETEAAPASQSSANETPSR